MTGTDTVRNVALVGPNGSGKTTLLENLLYVAGAISRKGTTNEGTTVGDASPEARARQMGIEVNAVSFQHDGLDFTILDCPGSVEFAQEARNALLGIDAAVVVVEPVPERMISIAPILNYLDKNKIPHLVFINKMDRSEVPYRELLQSLREVSDRPVIPHQYAIGRGEDLIGYIDLVTERAYAYKAGAPAEPIELPAEYLEREQTARQEMLETLADFDDDLMELLLEDQEPPADDILRHMQNTLGADQVVPVFMGVAEQEMGARRLLEALAKEAPPPKVTVDRLGIDANAEPVVQIIKTYHLPHAGKLSLARVWAGEVKDGMTLHDAKAGDMRLSGVFKMFGAEHKPVGSAGAGEIVGLGRLEEAKTASVLLNGTGGDAAAIPVPRASPLKPMYAFAVSAENRNDEVKMSGAFSKLVEEDPSLRFEQDPELHQSLLWGQGEMHLRVALDRLRSKYHVDIKGQPPETPYRETIKKGTDSHGRHKKQSGGHGQFGDVKIKIDPRPAGAGFEFIDKIVGGAVPRQYIPAVESGAREFLQRGPLGFPVVDVSVTLYDGQFHSVDSSEIAFKMATAHALKEGLPECRPVLLEPILSVNISVPSEYTSKILQLISGKRGQILGYDGRKNWRGWDQVTAHIPQAEIHDMIIDLRSSTQGVAFFDWQHDHFDTVPDKVAESVVAKRQEQRAH
jgi:elongation factor G